VEHVLFPIRLPRTELNDEFWGVEVAATIELYRSAIGRRSDDPGSQSVSLQDHAYHDATRAPAWRIDSISGGQGAIM
jgi:hypothetical protein